MNKQLHPMLDAMAESIKPRQRMSLSQWAEQYAVLSAENSAIPGPFTPYPYQREIMDAFTDPNVETISVMKSARIGWTRILDNAIGYAVHQDPAALLVVQPTIEDAQDYSRDELEPMIRDTPVLNGLVADAKKNAKDNSVKRKTFPGGSIRLIGANAPRGFRRITVKRVFFDEVDGYPTKGAGVEGDQIALGRKRADTYEDRKIALGSTPTVKGTSRIEASYLASDQRRYFVPCPHCEEMQVLEWENFRWRPGHPETVRYVCQHCGAEIEEREKFGMVARGQWRAAKPERNRHAGFHIWAAYSFSPGAAWPRLAEEYEEARKLPNTLKVFVNQVLGRTFADEGSHPHQGSLQERAEVWEGVPAGVLFTTLGVDVQGDRLEMELVGWGVDEENWSLEYKKILGDPAQPQVWQDLQAYIAEMKPAAVCVDSGGHHTKKVYEFAQAYAGRRVYAIKGLAGQGKLVWPRQASESKLVQGAKVYIVGVDSAKDIIYARLRIATPGPGYCHFPKGRDEEWFAGMTSESVNVKFSRGFPVREYVLRTGMRNEPLDCRVYAYAGLVSFGRISWAGLVRQRSAKDQQPAEELQEVAQPVATPAPAVANPQRPRPFGNWKRNNWATGWRR